MALPPPHAAHSERFGRSCWFHELTGSTNDDAAALADEGAPHGSMVLADAQTAGRGRLGRDWHSPAGQNLYFSLVLRPRTAPADTPLLTIAAGVAMAEVLGLRLKWPNDVVTEDFHKIAGILSEIDLSQGRVNWVVLGVGLNVNQRVFPEDLPMARSLRQLRGETLDRWELLERLLPALDRRVAQVQGERERLVRDWSALAATTDRQVRVGELRGTALGLRPDGALLVRDASGRIHPVVAGDVLLDEPR